MKTYTLELPYFKKGDDVGFCLSKTKSVSEALLMHAENMDAAAALCRRVAEFPELEIEADCHFIWVKGPQEILDKLVAEETLCVEDFGDDEDCDGNCEGCPEWQDCVNADLADAEVKPEEVQPE